MAVGDWYTGHELGHTFGRFHAEFCGAGGGAPYPFTNGQLSNADGAFVGFDVGDASRGIPGRALPGVVWHDVMSYCASQWLSSFTYVGIRDRLVLEDAIPAGAMPPAARPRTRGKTMKSSGAVHVVATLNLTRGTGHLQHVTPVPTVPAEQGRARSVSRRSGRSTAPPVDISLRVYAARDRLITEVAPAFIPDACLNPGDDLTGAIDTFLTGAGGASRLELLLNGVIVDTVYRRHRPGPCRISAQRQPPNGRVRAEHGPRSRTKSLRIPSLRGAKPADARVRALVPFRTRAGPTPFKSALMRAAPGRPWASHYASPES